jgi:Zn finger protein HypA/HybF involved in hydrogenase expression
MEIAAALVTYRGVLYLAGRISPIPAQHRFAAWIGSAAVIIASSSAAAIISLKDENIALSGLVGLFWFRLVGGNPKIVLPADLCAKGPFAKDAVAVVRDASVNAAQKLNVQKIGRKFGCHSCGRFLRFWEKRFIADHIPPTKLKAKYEGVDSFHVQKLYPHCPTCATRQGNAVATGKKRLVMPNLWTYRPEYIWMPIMPMFEQLEKK